MDRPGRPRPLGGRRDGRGGRGAATPGRLITGARRPWFRRPWTHDALITGAILALALANEGDHGHPVTSGWSWVFDVALALPLLWRRRQPLAVFLAVSAVALVQWSTTTPVPGDVAVLAALYAVGAHERRRWALTLAAVVGEVGVVLAVVRWAPPGHVIDGSVLLTGTVTAAWVVGRYVRTRRDYVASVLERATTAERERDQQAQFAAAAERARIAREMHDVVTHTVSVMVALSDGAAASAERSPAAARDAAEKAGALGRQALSEMRRLLGVLHSPDEADLAPQPGLAQLDELVGQVRLAGLAVDLVVAGEPSHLPASAQLAVYRLVQESLTNVLKHAPAATRATVTVRYAPGGVDVVVDNDDVPRPAAPSGSHPASHAAPASQGYGVAGMRERVAVFDGTLTAARRQDGGWRVAGHLDLAGEGVAR